MTAESIVNRPSLVSIVAIAALGSLGAFGALATFGALASCRDATQITVTIESEVPGCGVYTLVTAGKVATLGDASITSSHDGGCTAPNKIGNVVLTPSGERDAPIAFQVTTTLEDGGTIVARRALRFVEYASLDVRVTMRANCVTGASPFCEASDHTCVDGKCVSAVCEGACDERELIKQSPVFEDGGARDAATDGDAAAIADAGDGGPPTNCGGWAGVQAGAPWPMEGQCKTHRRRSTLAGPRRGLTFVPVLDTSNVGVTFPIDPLVDSDGNVFLATGKELSMLDSAEMLHRNIGNIAPQGSGVIADDGTAHFPTATGFYSVRSSNVDGGVSIPTAGGARSRGFNVTASGALIGSDGPNIRGIWKIERDGGSLNLLPTAGASSVIPSIDGPFIYASDSTGRAFVFNEQGIRNPRWPPSAPGDELNRVSALSKNWVLFGAEKSPEAGLVAVGRPNSDAGSRPQAQYIGKVAIGDDDGIYVCRNNPPTVIKLNGSTLFESALGQLLELDGGPATGSSFFSKPTLDSIGTLYVMWNNRLVVLDQALLPVRENGLPLGVTIPGLNQSAHGDTSIVIRRNGELIIQGPGGVFKVSGSTQ